MKTTMKSIREELKSVYDIKIVFVGKRDGVSVYRVYAGGFSVNSTEYTKDEIIKKWMFL